MHVTAIVVRPDVVTIHLFETNKAHAGEQVKWKDGKVWEFLHGGFPVVWLKITQKFVAFDFIAPLCSKCVMPGEIKGSPPPTSQDSLHHTLSKRKNKGSSEMCGSWQLTRTSTPPVQQHFWKTDQSIIRTLWLTDWSAIEKFVSSNRFAKLLKLTSPPPDTQIIQDCVRQLAWQLLHTNISVVTMRHNICQPQQAVCVSCLGRENVSRCPIPRTRSHTAHRCSPTAASIVLFLQQILVVNFDAFFQWWWSPSLASCCLVTTVMSAVLAHSCFQCVFGCHWCDVKFDSLVLFFHEKLVHCIENWFTAPWAFLPEQCDQSRMWCSGCLSAQACRTIMHKFEKGNCWHCHHWSWSTGSGRNEKISQQPVTNGLAWVPALHAARLQMHHHCCGAGSSQEGSTECATWRESRKCCQNCLCFPKLICKTSQLGISRINDDCLSCFLAATKQCCLDCFLSFVRHVSPLKHHGATSKKPKWELLVIWHW